MQRKYLKTGEAVGVIQKLDSGFLVERLMRCDSNEEHFYDGEPMVVVQVFDEPPTQVYDDRIAAKQAQIDELEQKRRTLEAALREDEKTAKERRDALKRHDKLNLLDDFIAGKITHFVTTQPLEIKTFEEALNRRDEYDKGIKLRLLSLYGESKGDIAWKIGAYSDGSGSNYEVLPCSSYDHAREVAQQLIERGDRGDSWMRYRMLACAETHGLTVPAEWIEERDRNLRESREKAVHEAEKKLADARMALEALAA